MSTVLVRRIARGLNLLFVIIGLTSSANPRTARSASPVGLTQVSAPSRVREIAAAAGVKLTSYVNDEAIQRLKSHGLTEDLVKVALETVMAACLSRGPTSPPVVGETSAGELANREDPCKAALGAGNKQLQQADWLATWLTHIADVTPGKPTATMRLLARLSARDVQFVDIELLLRRRHQLTKVKCEPPVAEEIEQAAANLNDFLVVTRRDVRRLNKNERADIAYALVSDATQSDAMNTTRLMTRLDAGEVSIEDLEILRRRHRAAMVSSTPPNADAVKQTAANLPDFIMVTQRETRSLSEVEKADLAYALASLDKSGETVGSPLDDTLSPPLHAGDPELAAHQKREVWMKQALAAGNIEQYVALAKADLVAFGYPGAIRIHADGDMRWGGAGMSYTMRKVALYSELLGDVKFASDLYRRANPGGGACGTSRDYVWESQVEGAIRTGEAMGQCRLVVADRLLAIDGNGESTVYGPTQLAAAGFDVERIYRGALLTLNQYVPGSELKSVLVDNVGDDSTRSQPREPADWARRIYALEGYADTAQKRSVPLLLSLARESQPEIRARILRALGEVATGTKDDPCNPEYLNGLSFSVSNIWSRKIRQANSVCETRFSAIEKQRLVDGILPILSDADGAVRTAAAIALGKIASRRAGPALRRLQRDPYTVPGLEETVGNRSVPIYSVRKAVQSALRHIQQGDGTGDDFD